MRRIINAADYYKVKKMNLMQFNDYILNMYLSGKSDMKEEIMGDSDECLLMDEYLMKDILLSVNGITEATANEVINKIFSIMEGEK